MGPLSQIVLLDDLGREKTEQWMVWIGSDGVEEGVVGNVAYFTEVWLFGDIISGLDTSSQERLESLLIVSVGEAPPGGRGICQLCDDCGFEYELSAFPVQSV